MKKSYQIIIVIAWIVSGIWGGIKFDLKSNDLTVGRLTGAVLIGSCVGPMTWIVYFLDSDVTLIMREVP